MPKKVPSFNFLRKINAPEICDGYLIPYDDPLAAEWTLMENEQRAAAAQRRNRRLYREESRCLKSQRGSAKPNANVS